MAADEFIEVECSCGRKWRGAPGTDPARHCERCGEFSDMGDDDGPDDLCDHGDASYDLLTGRAHCHHCDTVWYPDATGARSLNPLA